MSTSFANRERGTELTSIANTLDKYINLPNDSIETLTIDDLDRDTAVERNNESVQNAISADRQDILSACAARIAEESRAIRDINIAKASRIQLMLGRFNIAYNRYLYLKKHINRVE